MSDADVVRIARRDFDARRIDEVLAILDEYGDESWHREPARARVAALMLAAGSVERLRRQVESAKCDYRDALVAAEYPGYCRLTGIGERPADEVQEVIDADWERYQHWLAK